MAKKTVFLLNIFFLKLFFSDDGHLYSKCLFDILTIYQKFHILHFFSRGIRIQISILTKVQNECISLRKESVLLIKNVLFEGSFP